MEGLVNIMVVLKVTALLVYFKTAHFGTIPSGFCEHFNMMV